MCKNLYVLATLSLTGLSLLYGPVDVHVLEIIIMRANCRHVYESNYADHTGTSNHGH